MPAAAVCAACSRPLDPERHAVCQVCGGRRLCLECARGHFCTPECAARGCHAGLCTKLVLAGVVAEEYGV